MEMSDLDNEPLVKLVGGELIETVVAHDVIGRLMIQCALQPGLAQVSYIYFCCIVFSFVFLFLSLAVIYHLCCRLDMLWSIKFLLYLLANGYNH